MNEVLEIPNFIYATIKDVFRNLVKEQEFIAFVDFNFSDCWYDVELDKLLCVFINQERMEICFQLPGFLREIQNAFEARMHVRAALQQGFRSVLRPRQYPEGIDQ